MFPGAFTQTPDYYVANAYDAVFMMAEAILKTGVQNRPETLQADRDRFKDYFANLHDFKGVASQGFNQDGDGVKDVQVMEAKDGHWRVLPAR
jgi:branched-chain amino acid transport system substrate-binding protein